MITSDRSDVSKINASHHNKPQEEGRRARLCSLRLAKEQVAGKGPLIAFLHLVHHLAGGVS